MAKAGHRLLFASTDPEHGYEVWVYDEKTGEFGMLADLWPGPDSSGPGQFRTFGDRVIFQARTHDAGLELWASDGTSVGTAMVLDINPGPSDSDPNGFVPVGTWAFFRVEHEALGQELWATDGSRSGTMRVADIMGGAGSSNPYNLAAHGKELFFTANDGVRGEELWRATLSGGKWKADFVSDLYPGPTGSEPHNLQWANEIDAYFLAKTPEAGETLCHMTVPLESSLSNDGPSFDIYPITAEQDTK
jgi:ELWxxDGT repeat protein